MHLENLTATLLVAVFFYVFVTSFPRIRRETKFDAVNPLAIHKLFSYLCKMFSFLYKRLAVVLLLTVFFYNAVAQTPEERPAPRQVVQIAGVVLDNENLRPIPHVNISVVGTHRGTTTNMQGFFTFVTFAGDSLSFSSMGFRTETIQIPSDLQANRFTIYQTLLRDTLELPVTVIFPWPSRERFREAFLSLDIPADDYDIARRNILLSELRERARHSPMDAQMNFRHLTQQRADRMYWAGQQQPNNLLNPMAWAQFLRIWNAQRDERRQQRVRDWDFYEP